MASRAWKLYDEVHHSELHPLIKGLMHRRYDRMFAPPSKRKSIKNWIVSKMIEFNKIWRK